MILKKNTVNDGEPSEKPGQVIVDEFSDVLWLEDGLSQNTLEACKRYRL